MPKHITINNCHECPSYCYPRDPFEAGRCSELNLKHVFKNGIDEECPLPDQEAKATNIDADVKEIESIERELRGHQ